MPISKKTKKGHFTKGPNKKRARKLSNNTLIEKVKRDQKIMEDAEFAALDLLERNWADKQNPEVSAAFNRLKLALATLKESGKACVVNTPEHLPAKNFASGEWATPTETGPHFFDPLDLIKRILMAKDLLFLSRQVTYHLSASAELPRIWADPDQIQSVLSQLIEHMVRRASRSSRIVINFKTLALRSGPGIEINFSSIDRHLTDANHESYLADIFQDKLDEVSGVSLSLCRQMISRQRGQLWVNFPKPNAPFYHLALPASEQTQILEQPIQQTFKYDISISNYADVRKRFGIRKSQSLVSQIENYVRSLVRYPIDMVMALSDKGIITTIYETQKGTAQSVASRISERLGSEIFRIGKKPVDISFSYRLSPLTVANSTRSGDAGKSSQH